MYDPIELGWMAGILDGEGSVVLVQNSTVRKADGRRAIVPRIYMSVADFEILEQYTTILTKWGISYTYTKMKYNVDDGDWSPKVNINIHRYDAVVQLLEIVTPHLTVKRKRAELILDYTHWRQENYRGLQHRYGKVDTTLYDQEYSYWNTYREIYAGRGKTKHLIHRRDLREAILIPNTPIHFPN